LPDEDGNIVPDYRPTVTSDSFMSYWPTVILADAAQFQYCYLYAVTINDDNVPNVPGDVDGDGVVNVADLLTLLASWGACDGPPCPADFDNNGTVNVADLLTVLANWS
jgi:hypothetical protein